MRRFALILVLSTSLSTFAAPADATATEALDAQFRQHFGRGLGASTGPCAIAFCGNGHVVGYGNAELTLVATSSVPISLTGCGFALAVTGIATIELQDGDTLVLEEAGTYCLPGESTFAPGNLFQSYGNPWEIDASYTVVGGSGVFAGAGGDGTNTIRQGGDAQIAVYSGAMAIG